MQKILHCLFSAEEEKEMRVSGFGLDTHGIQHVVLQFERGKRKSAEGVAGLLDQPQSVAVRVKRVQDTPCKHCKKLFSGAGHWKHEQYCAKASKGGR